MKTEESVSPEPTPPHASSEEGVQTQEHKTTHIPVRFSFGSSKHISPVGFHLLTSFSSDQNCFILIFAASVKVPVSKAGRKLQAAGSCGRQTAVQVQSPGSQPNVAGPGHADSEGPAAPTPQDPRPASEDTGTVLEPGDACVFEYKR